MTLFPEMCERVMGESILGRAQAKGVLEVHCHQIRDYTKNRQCQVDDYPYGGGQGMVLFPQPIADCFRAVCGQAGERPYLVYMSPQGRVLTQQKALELSQHPNLCVLCGHYEGVDERMLDWVARMVPGVLSEEACFTEESHFSGLLEFPQYTRPAEWEGRAVPDILLSGHHANIQKWRREQAIRRTVRKRPDLLPRAELTEKERQLAESLLREEAAASPDRTADDASRDAPEETV